MTDQPQDSTEATPDYEAPAIDDIDAVDGAVATTPGSPTVTITEIG